MDGLTVGEAARRAGVHIQTIHYYERRELLPPPDRSPSNYRLYTADSVRRTLFIKKAQRLGFTLEEIKQLLSLKAEPVDSCAEVRVKAEEKVKEIGEKIGALRGMQRALAALIEECSGRAPATGCPILVALDEGMNPEKEST